MIGWREFNEAGERMLSAIGVSIHAGLSEDLDEVPRLRARDALARFEERNEIEPGLIQDANNEQMELAVARIKNGAKTSEVLSSMWTCALLTGWFMRDKAEEPNEREES